MMNSSGMLQHSRKMAEAFYKTRTSMCSRIREA